MQACAFSEVVKARRNSSFAAGNRKIVCFGCRATFVSRMKVNQVAFARITLPLAFLCRPVPTVRGFEVSRVQVARLHYFFDLC